MREKKVYCPKCQTPGANVGIWGSGELDAAGYLLDEPISFDYDPKDTYKCLSGECDFEGDRSDFEHEINQAA